MAVLLLICIFGNIGFFGDQVEFAGVGFIDFAIEAAIISDVTLAGINGNLQQQAVLIAVNENLFYLLEMAGLLTFFPEPLPCPAEVNSVAGFDGLVERLCAHISEHKDPACIGILCDNWYQACTVEFGGEFQTIFNCVFLCHDFSPYQLSPAVGVKYCLA